MWDNWYGWKKLVVNYIHQHPYTRNVYINDELIKADVLDGIIEDDTTGTHLVLV